MTWNLFLTKATSLRFISFRKNVFFLLLTVLVFSSCSFNSIYENTADIPKGNWNKNTPLSFTAPVTDTLHFFNIIFSIRNDNNYPYSNIFLLIDTRSPRGIVVRDTLELELCDSQGKWYGKGIGGIWQNKVYFRKNVRFPNSGNYVFKITQAMRDDNLAGIIDLGIKIEEFSK
jgi:gliding motility-associated lipoprotein GldH